MNEEKYLYVIRRGGEGTYRYKITRESDANYWIRINENGEEKISKRTMTTGSEWHKTYYYEETENLKKTFVADYRKRKFLRKLDELKSCEDVEIMEKILAI